MRTMKTLSMSILFSVVALQLSAQHTPLRGQVTIQNSLYKSGKLEYVSGAHIWAPFAAPAITDERGQFELLFAALPTNAGIRVTCEHPDLEVVNAMDLEHVTISQDRPLQVTMAKKGHLALAQTEFYRISKAALFARRDAIISQLRKNVASRDSTIAMLEIELGQKIDDKTSAERILIERVAEVESRLPEIAIEMASKNLDFASTLYRRAYELYLSGEVMAAINTLNDEVLEKQYLESKEALRKAEGLKQASSSLYQSSRQSKMGIVESYHTKGDWLAAELKHNGSIMAFERALSILLEDSIPEDRGHIIAARMKLGLAYLAASYWQKAKEQLGMSLDCVLSDSGAAPLTELVLRWNLAMCEVSLGMTRESRQHISLMVRLSPFDSVFDIHSQSFLNIFSVLSISEGNFEEGIALMTKLDSVMDSQGASLCSRARNKVNLSNTYRLAGWGEKSLKEASNAISMLDSLIQGDCDCYAGILHELAMCNFELDSVKNAIQLEGLAIKSKESCLGKYHPSFLIYYSNLAYYWAELGNLHEAVQIISPALLATKDLEDTPKAHIAEALNTISRILELDSLYDQSRQFQLISLAMRKGSVDSLNIDLINCYHRMGTLHLLSGNIDSTLYYDSTALARLTRIPFAMNSPKFENIRFNLAYAHEIKGHNHKEQGDLSNAILEYSKSINYEPSNANTYLIRAIALSMNNDTVLADRDYAQACKLDSHLCETVAFFLIPDLLARGLTDDALPYLRIEGVFSHTSYFYFCWAQYWALKGDVNMALQNLEQSGYTNLDRIANEKAFDQLRDHPRYITLIKALEEKSK